MIPSESANNSPTITTFTGLLLRLFWILVGNVAAAACLVKVFQHGRAGLSFRDGIYAATVGLTLLARYVDIRFYSGTTSDAKPATMKDWWRYCAVFGGGAAIVWLGAHAILLAMGD